MNIRLYLKHIRATKHFSFGVWTSRQILIVAIDEGEHTGYGECILATNDEQYSLKPIQNLLQPLQSLSPKEALDYCEKQKDHWRAGLIEAVEIALLDLQGKIKGVPTVELLGFTPPSQTELCGVHVILSDDLKEVEESSQWAKEQSKDAFIKVKLFGDLDLDRSVIETVRKVCPEPSTYLIGDVNCGYAPDETLEQAMLTLRNAGLNACEDPAKMDHASWQALQAKVDPLALIPDEPMRPARKAVKDIEPGMAHIFNIHPDCMGSIIDAIALAKHVKELGSGLMIGDDSLVGPACTAWQQLAIVLEATWVEACEKKDESDFFYAAVKEMATDSRHNPISIDWRAGFGIEMNEDELRRNIDAVCEI